jgi:hypothetical protein
MFEKLAADPLSMFPELKGKLNDISSSMEERQGVALREFTSFILEQDKVKRFQNLERIIMESGDVCWMCSEHAAPFKTGQVEQSCCLSLLPQHGRRSRPTSAVLVEYRAN